MCCSGCNEHVETDPGQPLVNGLVSVSIESLVQTPLTLILRDICGRMVKTSFNTEVLLGINTQTLDVSDIAAGSYVLSLRSTNEQSTIRIEIAP